MYWDWDWDRDDPYAKPAEFDLKGQTQRLGLTYGLPREDGAERPRNKKINQNTNKIKKAIINANKAIASVRAKPKMA
jgi:hypothetical protein